MNPLYVFILLVSVILFTSLITIWIMGLNEDINRNERKKQNKKQDKNNRGLMYDPDRDEDDYLIPHKYTRDFREKHRK